MEINSGGASRAHGDFSSSSSPSGLKTCLQDFISKSKGFSDNPDDQAKELSQAFLNLTQGVSSLDDPKLLKLESTLDSLSLPLSRVCSSSP
ncbi:MAG: hypothetical protein MRY21_04270, partial [Simkaniaceae bacterium]|nr:hypothetical protein [Simkaniaceae bacterium]